LSAVESKPASDGRINTSYFFQIGSVFNDLPVAGWRNSKQHLPAVTAVWLVFLDQFHVSSAAHWRLNAPMAAVVVNVGSYVPTNETTACHHCDLRPVHFVFSPT
jgi:hypothetical protein